MNFWHNNLQGIEEISKNLERYIYNLEKKYFGFDLIYDKIINQIDILSSIYSSYNSINGKEYVLKLKSLLKEYKKRYTHEGINFNAIYYLHSKIDELRQISFENFPKLDHSVNTSINIPIRENNETSFREKAQFKWITFKRNGSWFITPFDDLQIMKSEEIETVQYNESITQIKIGKDLYDVVDIFSRISVIKKEQPKYFLIVREKNMIRCFAAKTIGKRIFSGRDIISPYLSPIKNSQISPGRIRIFGKGHLYL